MLQCYELKEAYIRITNQKYAPNDMDQLVALCILHDNPDEFTPYLSKVDCMKNIFDIEVGSYPVSDAPFLLALLLCEERYFNSLKYVFDNWQLFYSSPYEIIKNMFMTLPKAIHQHVRHGGKFDYQLPGVKLLIEFCGKFDIIQIINDYQKADDMLYSWYFDAEMNFIKYLVIKYDPDYKYNIIYPRQFFGGHIKNRLDFISLFERYQFAERGKLEDIVNLMMCALEYKNVEVYLYLHQLGFRCNNQPGFVLLAAFDDHVFDTIEEVDVPTLLSSLVFVDIFDEKSGNCRYIKISECIRVIEKFVHDINSFIIRLSEIQRNIVAYSGKPKLFQMLLTEGKEFRPDNNGDMLNLVQNYDMNVMFQNNWKQNFKMMLRLNRNYTSLYCHTAS